MKKHKFYRPNEFWKQICDTQIVSTYFNSKLLNSLPFAWSKNVPAVDFAFPANVVASFDISFKFFLVLSMVSAALFTDEFASSAIYSEI